MYTLPRTMDAKALVVNCSLHRRRWLYTWRLRDPSVYES